MATEKRSGKADKKTFLSDVILGQVSGRVSDDEITCFTSSGISIQVIATACKIYQLVKEKDLSRKLPMFWFLRDIRS